MAAADLSIQIKAVNEATRELRRISGDLKTLDKSASDTNLRKVNGELAKASKFKMPVLPVAALVGGLGLAGVAAVKFTDAASDLAESQSKVNVVFGPEAKAIQDWSKTTATAIGISKQAALEAAGTFGNLFDAMGLGKGQSATLSKDLVTLASDLASFNNISTGDALQKLQSGLVGEAEPLRALGVNINEAAVKTKALELGLAGVGGELSDAAKVQARYALIVEQTKNAQGDFSRTSDGLANKQRILKAQWADMQATIGTGLLPVVTALGGALSTFITKHQPEIEAFSKALEEKLPGAFEAIGEAINKVAPTVKYIFDNIAEGFDTLRPGLEWIVNNKVAMTAALAAIGAAAILAFAPISLPVLATVAALGGLLFTIGLVRDHWEELSEPVKRVAGEISSRVQGFVQGVREILTQWGILDIVSGQFEQLRGVLQIYIAAITGIIKVGMALLQGDWSAAWNALKETVSGVFEGLKTIVSGKIEELKGIITLAAQFGDLLFEAGKELVQGLVDGIKDKAAGITGAIGDVASGIKNTFKGALGIQSPSKVFHEYGVQTLQGYLDGLQSMEPQIDDLFKSLLDRAHELSRKLRKAINTTTYNVGGSGFTFSGNLTDEGLERIRDRYPDIPFETRRTPAPSLPRVPSATHLDAPGARTTYNAPIYNTYYEREDRSTVMGLR